MDTTTAQSLFSVCYLVSGFVMAGRYVPQVLRGWRNPEATVIAQSFSSWAVWAVCRTVALAYGVWVLSDPLFVLAVGLDLAGRLGMLAVLIRARWLQASARQRAAANRGSAPRSTFLRLHAVDWRLANPSWIRGVVLVSCLAVVGCRESIDGSKPSSAESATYRRVAAFQQQALNQLLLPLLEPDDPPLWRDPALALACGGHYKITVDGQEIPVGHRLPARSFVLRWTGTWPGGIGNDIYEMTGEVVLLVFHDGDSYSAVVTPIDLVVSTPDGPLKLSKRFAARTPLVPVGPSA